MPILSPDVRRAITISLGILVLVTAFGTVVATTNVVSIDGDSMPAFEEFQTGTNPLAADTDEDGLMDGVEVNEYGTEPTVADTDEDGLDDGPEVNEYGTEPTVADTDEDGLDDATEVNEYGTEPTVDDTDEDGLDDGPEVNEYGTEPTVADMDNDGLDDGREIELNTNPTDPDTDSDGLPDGSEVNNDALSGANPLHVDIFLEVDYVYGHKPPDRVLELARGMYDDAPVSNPDGSTGITLHVSYNDSIPTDGRVNVDELDETLMPEHFDHENEGYHYAVAVKDAWWDGESVGGVAGGSNGQFIFETTYANSDAEMEDKVIASIFVHELGHSVGISDHDYRGVDSYDVTYSKYTSVMNYNAPSDAIVYSDGEPFNDWAYIENNLFTPYIEI